MQLLLAQETGSTHERVKPLQRKQQQQQQWKRHGQVLLLRVQVQVSVRVLLLFVPSSVSCCLMM